MNFKALISYSLILVLMSCSRSSNDSDKGLISPFIDASIDILTAKAPVVTKVSKLNGKQDTVQLTSIKWENELSIFKKSDIKAEQRVLYNFDTVAIDSLHFVGTDFSHQPITAKFLVNVNSKDTAQSYHKIRLMLDHNYNVVEANIAHVQKHQLFDIRKHLNFNPYKGYSVIGNQSLDYLDSLSFNVNATW